MTSHQLFTLELLINNVIAKLFIIRLENDINEMGKLAADSRFHVID